MHTLKPNKSSAHFSPLTSEAPGVDLINVSTPSRYRLIIVSLGWVEFTVTQGQYGTRSVGDVEWGLETGIHHLLAWTAATKREPTLTT